MIPVRAQDAHQALERDVLVGEGVPHRLPFPGEERREGQCLVHLAAKHHRVDEDTDHALEFGATSAGCHGAHTDVLAARVVREKHPGRCDQHREDGRTFPPGHLAQCCHQVTVHVEHVERTASTADGWSRAIGGEFGGRQPVQLLPPVVQLAPLPGVILSGLFPGGIVDVLERQLRERGLCTPHRCGVQRHQVVDQQGHRPAVADDVVRVEHEDVLVGGQPNEDNPQQRPVLQIEGTPDLAPQDPVEFGPRPFPVMVPQVDPHHRCLSRGVDDLDANPVLSGERSPERLVPLDERPDRVCQRVRVEPPSEAEDLRSPVLHRVRVQLVQEPQALLRARLRNDPTPIHGNEPVPFGGALDPTSQLPADELTHMLRERVQAVLGNGGVHDLLRSSHGRQLRPRPVPTSPGSCSPRPLRDRRSFCARTGHGAKRRSRRSDGCGRPAGYC